MFMIYFLQKVRKRNLEQLTNIKICVKVSKRTCETLTLPEISNGIHTVKEIECF